MNTKKKSKAKEALLSAVCGGRPSSVVNCEPAVFSLLRPSVLRLRLPPATCLSPPSNSQLAG